MDLLEWLTGCLDHLEAAARAATPGPWQWDCEEFSDNPVCPHSSEWEDHGPNLETVARDPKYPSGGIAAETVIGATDYDASSVIVLRADAEHIKAHDPRAVLARVEAERAIVQRFRDDAAWAEHPDNPTPGPYFRSAGTVMDTLRLLAWGHRFDFPGYDEAWAPEGADRG